VCSQTLDGVSQAELHAALEGQATLEEIANAVNELSQAVKLKILIGASGDLLFKAPNETEQQQFGNLTQEQTLVYQIVEQAGSMGIWTREIKRKSNLPQPTLTKILKMLETRKLVKWVFPITAKNRKFYLLYNTEPHQDIQGGPWYQGQEIDTEFVKILRQQCRAYIEKKKFASVEDVAAFIKKTGVSKVPLSTEHVQTLLNTVRFDGEIEEVGDPRSPSRSVTGQSKKLYKVTRTSLITNSLTSTPCGQCPVFSVCDPNGDISPISCVYLSTWLDM